MESAKRIMGRLLIISTRRLYASLLTFCQIAYRALFIEIGTLSLPGIITLQENEFSGWRQPLNSFR